MAYPDHDIIIVGAGPAGAMLAWQLLEKSSTMASDSTPLLDVIVIESHSGAMYDAYHRKCGEGVSKKAMEMIKPCATIVQELKTAVEHWGSTPDHEFPAPGFIIDRPATLRAMTERFVALGGKMLDGSFLSATMENGLVVVVLVSGERMTCRLLVGADGPNSRVRKACGFGDAKLTTLVQCIVNDDRATPFTEIWYGQRYKGGYKYRFPAGNGTAKIGFIQGTDEYAGEFIEKQARQVAWGGLDRYYKDGVVLIGDAAAQCNPITGGGMRGAFVAGERLAEALRLTAYTTSDKTIALQKAAELFAMRWSKTPYESRKYVKAHDVFEHMTDDDLALFSEPIRGNPLSMLKKIKWWWLYRAFMNADKYSW